jgi:hypothetical protein
MGVAAIIIGVCDADDLAPAFTGCDVVVHLAWLSQPAHRRGYLHRANVDGATRVDRAALAADVPAFVPVLPLPRSLRVQAVHPGDVASAYALAVTSDVTYR